MTIPPELSPTATPTSSPPSSSSTQTPTSTPVPDNSNSSSNVGAIAGGVGGGVAILFIGLAILWFCRRRRQKKSVVAAYSADAIRQSPANEAKSHKSGQLQLIRDTFTLSGKCAVSVFADSFHARSILSSRYPNLEEIYSSVSDFTTCEPGSPTLSKPSTVAQPQYTRDRLNPPPRSRE